MLALLCAALLGAVSTDDAPLWASPAQSAAPAVGVILFEGAEPETVRALVDVQVGAPLDARDVRDAVRALHASARFSRVAAYVEPMGDGRVRFLGSTISTQIFQALTTKAGRETLTNF